MAMLLAALHPRRQDASDRGMTLVELLVSMMLLTIVIGLATGLLINGMNRQSNIGQSTDAMNTNQNGMELMTRLLRQAVYPNTSSNSAALPIISSATPTQIVFTS